MSKILRVLVSTVIVLVGLSVFLSGCKGNSSVNESNGSQLPTPTITSSGQPELSTVNQPSDLSAQEIALNSLAAIEKMKSFKFDIDFDMSFTLPAGLETGAMTMQQTATSSINIPDKQMHMIMQMEMDVPEQGRQNISAEIYSADGWMYAKADVPGFGAQWTKIKLTDEMWTKQSQLSSMTDFLKAPVGLELVGSESVQGVDCYVLNVTPDMNSLSSWMEGQMQSGTANVAPGGMDYSQSFQEFAVKEWIAKNNFLLVKQQIRFNYNPINETPALPGGGDNQMMMSMNASLDYYNYGEPVNIQIPTEALNAKELTPPE